MPTQLRGQRATVVGSPAEKLPSAQMASFRGLVGVVAVYLGDRYRSREGAMRRAMRRSHAGAKGRDKGTEIEHTEPKGKGKTGREESKGEGKKGRKESKGKGKKGRKESKGKGKKGRKESRATTGRGTQEGKTTSRIIGARSSR